jgi:ubiquinol-cytochrome c reductase cytochrome b subunit
MSPRIEAWLAERYPVAAVRGFFAKQAGKLLPEHTSWWHTLGSLLLFLTINQVVTGLLLMVYYRPAPETSFESVRFITTKANFGWLIRGLHAWGADAMILLLVLHMFRTYVMGAFKKPRELTWVVGVLVFGVVLTFGFTGYLLPWNQRSYWATVVGTEIAGALPLLGDGLKTLLRGGDAVGDETLSRFYVLHVAVLPWLLVAGVAIHILLVRVHGLAPLTPVGQETLDERKGVRFFPRHVARESVVFMAFLTALVAVVFLVPPEVGAKADPLRSPEGVKPEWYFLPTYQLLKLFPKLLGIVVSFVPFLLLLLWPFLDRGPARHPRQRRWGVGLGVVALLLAVAFGVLGHVSERTFELAGRRVRFDMNGVPEVVGEVLPAEDRPTITVAATTEEGQRMVLVTVTRRGQRLERVKVAVSVEGQEGPAPIGMDETLDDGTAALPFPTKTRGDADGRLRLVATVQSPDSLAGSSGEALLPGGVPTPHDMWTRSCPEAAAIVGAVLVVGLLTTLAFRLLATRLDGAPAKEDGPSEGSAACG